MYLFAIHRQILSYKTLKSSVHNWWTQITNSKLYFWSSCGESRTATFLFYGILTLKKSVYWKKNQNFFSLRFIEFFICKFARKRFLSFFPTNYYLRNYCTWPMQLKINLGSREHWQQQWHCKIDISLYFCLFK